MGHHIHNSRHTTTQQLFLPSGTVTPFKLKELRPIACLQEHVQTQRVEAYSLPSGTVTPFKLKDTYSLPSGTVTPFKLKELRPIACLQEQ